MCDLPTAKLSDITLPYTHSHIDTINAIRLFDYIRFKHHVYQLNVFFVLVGWMGVVAYDVNFIELCGRHKTQKPTITILFILHCNS